MKRQRPQPLSDRMLELCTVVFAFCLSSSAAYANSDVLGFLFTLYTYMWWHPTPVLLPGKSHGQRSLVGCSPWGRGESDTTERLHLHFSLSCTGEGNGNPLQCSCLENPRDSRVWWSAVYGVVQSQTRLKWLSSSSSVFFVVLSQNKNYIFDSSKKVKFSWMFDFFTIVIIFICIYFMITLFT